ncbi:c-type cytochrome [Pseudomonas sp. LRF_L74]|uniref:c-type cytochrome n=1 Tax=Pseudomonas sp. LRF_L74 TaxID=3369422 RepID=UPI003F5FC12A
MKKLAVLLLGLAIGSSEAAQDPETVFNRSCGLCHNGQSAAPRKGNAEAWKPRLSQGMDALVKHVTDGFNAMPPRGFCTDCTAEDYQAVIGWMANSRQED